MTYAAADPVDQEEACFLALRVKRDLRDRLDDLIRATCTTASLRADERVARKDYKIRPDQPEYVEAARLRALWSQLGREVSQIRCELAARSRRLRTIAEDIRVVAEALRVRDLHAARVPEAGVGGDRMGTSSGAYAVGDAP